MALKPLKLMGEQNLLARSTEVLNFATAELRELIQDMRDTMRAKEGVGIAAPQIGCNWRVIMLGFEHSARYPNEGPVPFTVLINPVIEILTTEIVANWEGCLSIPGLRGLVPRAQKIKYSGFDVEGKPVEKIVENFHARIMQHEMDHIDGILYPCRIQDLRDFGFEGIIWPRA